MQRAPDPSTHRDGFESAPARVAESERESTSPHHELLAAAAESAAQAGTELDAFMTSAWKAFMAARPGLREQIEHRQLVNQLETLRQAGKLGQA